MIDKVRVSFRPTTKQLDEIKEWLFEEYNSTGDGFSVHWEQIYSSFRKKELATISRNKQIIGFVTWRYTSDFTSKIELAEMHPFFRKKGFGKVLITELFSLFVSKNILVVDLQCSPTNSEKVWKKLGFIEFPSNSGIWNRNNKELYKILIPVLPKLKKKNDAKETLELWYDEPHSLKEQESTCKWGLVFKENSRELLNPIVHPCYYKWRIRWQKNGQMIKDNSINYFTRDKNFALMEIDFARFLIITELPELLRKVSSAQ